MRIELARLYARTRRDGAVTLSGKMGYNGRLRIVPNPDKIEGDDRSPDFIAYLEEIETQDNTPYRGPQLRPQPRQPRAFVEGEVVD